MIRRSIPQGVNLPPSLIPRRLDKPVYSATSQSYADILKKQFSLTPTTMTDTTDHNRPPRKRQATKLDYDSDMSSETPTTSTATSQMTGHSPPPNAPPAPMMPTIAAELLSLKSALTELHSVIKSAVEQIKNAVASIPTPCTVSQGKMETDETMVTTAEHPQKIINHSPTTNELSDLIAELRHDIATIVLKSRAMFQQQAILKTPINQKNTSVT